MKKVLLIICLLGLTLVTGCDHGEEYSLWAHNDTKNMSLIYIERNLSSLPNRPVTIATEKYELDWQGGKILAKCPCYIGDSHTSTVKIFATDMLGIDLLPKAEYDIEIIHPDGTRRLFHLPPIISPN